MTNPNPINIDNDDDDDAGGIPHLPTHASDAGAASNSILKMTSQNPIILDDEVTELHSQLSTHSLNAGVSVSQSSKTTNNDPLTVDEEAMERPPYTGIQQWTAMKEAATRDPAPATLSNSAANPPPTSSDPQVPPPSSSSQICRRPTASAYYHLPVPPPDQPQPSAPARVLWHIPPQPVCKGAEQPTPVCGKWSRALREPPRKPRRNDTGPYRCPRCEYGYARVASVRLHFPRCVAVNGNPDCDSWTDDDSCVARQSKVATKEEEEEAWGKILNDLKEETRNGQEMLPEMEALIQLFKEEGLWDSGSEDGA